VGIGEDWLYLGEKDIRVVEGLVQIDPKRTILLSHYPPFGVVDFTLSDTHAGDGYLRRLIERYQPPLVICGHIHEAKGIDKIGDTLVVNPYNDPIIIDLERMEIDG
jgi:Predicted phosphoesterases, related to the Icc protein